MTVEPPGDFFLLAYPFDAGYRVPRSQAGLDGAAEVGPENIKSVIDRDRLLLLARQIPPVIGDIQGTDTAATSKASFIPLPHRAKAAKVRTYWRTELGEQALAAR